MGKKNDLLNHYLEKAEIFAEFCNVAIYKGQRMILPQDLADAQRNYARMKRGRDGVLRSTVRERDVMKLLCRSPHFVKIALENQDSLHYCMPLRCREYDDLELNSQLTWLKKSHHDAQDLKNGAEYLSGISSSDRLTPVVTIVFYHGKGDWNAARLLSDMLDTAGMDPTLKQLLPDYRMNLVCLQDLPEESFQTGLRDLIALLKRREDKKAMEKYLADNQERLSHIDQELYTLLCTMLNLSGLNRRREQYYNDETEDYDMCTAIRELRKESERIRERRGEKRGEERLGALIKCLTLDNRQEDVWAACTDASARQRLYVEYSV